MKKIIYIFTLIIFVLVFCLLLFIHKNEINIIDNRDTGIDNYQNNLYNEYYDYVINISNHLKKNATNKEKEIIYNYSQHPRSAITEMCKKNGNWSLLPIADEMYEKFNEKDGILSDQNFDNIEAIDEYNPNGMAQVVITKGKEKVKYTISFGVNFLLKT